MTDLDLDAIRLRLALSPTWTIPQPDAVALLAEVERLTAENEGLRKENDSIWESTDAAIDKQLGRAQARIDAALALCEPPHLYRPDVGAGGMRIVLPVVRVRDLLTALTGGTP